MERIISNVDPCRTLHMVVRPDDVPYERWDVIPGGEGLQLAAFRMDVGKTFRPHMHIPRPREIPYTQETWIIVDGTVMVSYFDLDGSLLCRRALRRGWCSITLAGGHTYWCKSPALVYEVKTGPFVGVMQDKVYLG